MRKAGLTLVVTGLLVLLAMQVTWGAPEQAVTITMRDFSYAPAKITVRAGIPAVFTLINKGKVAHEFMIYDMPKSMSMMMGHEWAEKTNYFQNVKVDVSGGKVRHMAGDFFEVRLAAGKTAGLRFTPLKRGRFEFGCMIEGHYEAGQKGVLVVK